MRIPPSSDALQPVGPQPAADPSAALTKGDAAMEQTVLQSPFVQNVLPLASSLLVHIGILALGLATYQAIREARLTVRDQYLIPDASFQADDGPEGGIPHPGLGGDPNRDAAQDQFPDVLDSNGINDKQGKDLTFALSGGAGDATDGIIGAGPGAAIIPGPGGPGDGGDGGPLAPFGIPGGGGGSGAKCVFASSAGRGRKIVFVCDATGSMMEHFDDLRGQLRKAIEPLKPSVKCNVVFIKEHPQPPIDPNLLVATPENKRRILSFVDGYTPSGPTDPIPALKAAFAMKPDLIFLFCDPSDFPNPQAVIDLCRSARAGGKMRINAICFDTHKGEQTLQQIAADSGGTFKNLSARELAEE